MKHVTLRRRFLTQVFSLLIVIAILSAGIQVYFMNQQIKSNIYEKSTPIANSIERGIEETDLASKMIEQQIDFKMIAIAKHIGDLLQTQKVENIKNEQLLKIKKDLNLAGLTIFARKDNDIVAVKSTDVKDIGFSTKSYGELVYRNMNAVLKGEEPVVQEGYTDKSILVLPIVKSGSHKEQPLFFKYAYYHPPGSDYIVNPFIEAQEVYKFTQEVGPGRLISQIEQRNPYVKEISVLNPKVFKNPSLEMNFYPPLRKVEHGDFKYQTKEDVEILKQMVDHPVKRISLQKVNGEKLYKVFLPINDNRVIYLALDYSKMTTPFYKYSIILMVSSLLSLLVLFLITVPFFNQIYENIQRVKEQIQLLADGDLTVKSRVKDGSELEILSNSVNKMVNKLHSLVSDTREQAVKTQRLSVMLEAEASQSVEKMYELSTETTIQSREQLHEIHEFLDEIEEVLNTLPNDENTKAIFDKMDAMRQIANDRTATTTEMTIQLSDLLQSLHGQSKELSNIANTLLQQISRFKL